MEGIFIDQINEREANDRAAMKHAIDELEEMVNGKREEASKDAGDPNIARTDRRLPARPLKASDLVRFVAESLSAKDFIWVFVASVTVTLLTMAVPYFNKQIFADVIPSGSTGMVLPIALVLFATGFGAVMFGVTRSLLLMRVRDKINVAVQSAMMQRTYMLPAPFFRQFASGDLATRVLAVSQVCQLASGNVLTGILMLIFSLTYFYQVMLYGPSLTTLCVLLLLANVVLIVVGYYYNARFVRQTQPHASRLQGVLFGLFNGIQKIKTSGSESRAFARWAKAYHLADPNNATRPFILSLLPALNTLLSLGGLAQLYVTAVGTNVELSDYIAFSLAYAQVSGAVSVIATLLPTLAQIRPLYDMARPILEAQPETEEELDEVDDLMGSIDVHNLRFRYPESSSYVFDGLSLSIRAGEYVGIVGSSGAGKSTLVRLLLGFETPEAGSIYYDNYNLAKVNKRQLRNKHIGTCLQDGRLFGGSIYENIIVTAPLATRDEVWEAARLADVADDIQEMPMQLNTIISDSGMGVSGGQRQRILIARALVGKPSILFLDEATSALDNIRQERVAQNLASTHCTRIAIAHRLSTVKACDRIIVLDQGRVAEEGTYDALMERRGKFYELVQRQQL